MRSLGLGLGKAKDASPSKVTAADPAVAAPPKLLRWTRQPSAEHRSDSVPGPTARHGHTATAIPGGRVVVVGGVCSHNDQGPLRDVHILHGGALTWQRGPDCPARTGVCFASATFVPSAGGAAGPEPEGQLVLLGGVGEAPRSMLSCTALHTHSPCTWSRQEAMQEPGYPEPRRSHSALLVDRCRIFVCGGVGQHLPSGEAFSDVWIFHLDSLLWLKAEPSGGAFPGRGGHSASLLGRQMLVFGGGVGASHFHDLWAFDVDHHVWTQVEAVSSGLPATVPLPRTGHAAVAFNGRPQQAASAGGFLNDNAVENGLVPVGHLLIYGGQSVATRGYLTLSSKDVFHVDSWHAELLLPSAAAARVNTSSPSNEDGLLLPSPTPAHSVGAQLRVRWLPLGSVDDANSTPPSPVEATEMPAGRSFHKAVPLTAASAASGFDLLVLGGNGASGSMSDHTWLLHGSLCDTPPPPELEPELVAVHHKQLFPPAGAAAAPAVGGDDAFLKKLELEDFFDAGAGASTTRGSYTTEESRPERPPQLLDSTVSTSSMDAWPTLSPEQTPAPVQPTVAQQQPATAAARDNQLEAATQLCAQLRDTVATTQQSEAKYRALAASTRASPTASCSLGIALTDCL